MAADAEATLPALIDAVKRLTTGDRRRVFEERGRKLATERQRLLERARTEATYAWDASPISTARLSAELWAQIKDADWALVSPVDFVSRWPMRLWDFDKPYQFLGSSGGAGVGYGAPAAAGAALAQQKARTVVGHHPGRRRSDVRARRALDGRASPDSAAVGHAQQPRVPPGSDARAAHGQPAQRGITQAAIGTTIDNPNIDFAGLARSLGVHAEGPITDPKDLAPAIRKRARSGAGWRTGVGRRGEPAPIRAGGLEAGG